MKSILALPLAAALALSGCAQAVAVRDFLADPKTQAAGSLLLAEAKAGATILSCAVGVGSSIALAVEQYGKTKGQTATGMIYVAASGLCGALGGTLAGTVKAQGGETVVTGTTAS